MQNLKIDAFTHIGIKKTTNEDAFAFHKDQSFFILADGVGGNLGGEIASTLAVDSSYETLKLSEKKFQRSKHLENLELLKLAISKSGAKINSFKLMRPHLENMSTTILACKIFKDYVYFSHIGDSQLSLLRNEYVYTLTKDHHMKTDIRKISSDKKKHLITNTSEIIKDNVLSRSLNAEGTDLIDSSYFQVKAKDYILLSSDGFHNFVDQISISKMLNTQKSAKDLVNCALSNGSQDNISLIIIKVL